MSFFIAGDDVAGWQTTIKKYIPGISDRAPWALFRKIALFTPTFFAKRAPMGGLSEGMGAFSETNLIQSDEKNHTRHLFHFI